MKSNSIFNFSRFVAVLKREFVINGRSLALMAIGSYAALALLMILGNALNIQEHDETPIIAVVVVTIFFSIITTIIGSLAFNSLKSKQGRINMFMQCFDAETRDGIGAPLCMIGKTIHRDPSFPFTVAPIKTIVCHH